MSSYVVAGVTGRVGSAVAGDLLARREAVSTVVRDAGRAEAWSRRGATAAVGSLADAEFLTGALKGASGFFVLLPEDPAAPDFHGARQRMADAIAAAVRRSGVPHVAMISSLGADLAEANGPIRGLHYLENALRAAGTRLTALRSSFFQENLASVIPAAREAGIYPNFLPSADVAFPMIATRDAGRFAAESLVAPPPESETVDLIGPAYSIRQLADTLGAALGRKLQIVDIPAAGHVAALTQAGVPRPMAEAIAELYAALAAGRILPHGSRRRVGATTLDQVLPGLLAPRAGDQPALARGAG